MNNLLSTLLFTGLFLLGFEAFKITKTYPPLLVPEILEHNVLFFLIFLWDYILWVGCFNF